jgi:hypothetical protein
MLKVSLPIFIAILCCFVPVILSRTKFGTPCDLSCRSERKAKGVPKVPFSADGWRITGRYGYGSKFKIQGCRIFSPIFSIKHSILGCLLLTPYSYDFSSVL